jgi:hypothetical protein
MEAMGSGVLICAWEGGVVFIAVRNRGNLGLELESRARGLEASTFQSIYEQDEGLGGCYEL